MQAVPSRLSPPVEYLVAILTVIAALGLRLLLDPVLGDAVPFATVFAALLVLLPTVRPGPFIAATAVAWLGALLFLVQPRFSLSTAGRSEWLQLALFAVAGVAAAVAGWLSHRVREKHTAELRLLSDAVPALISYVDAAGCYRLVNASYREWFGTRDEDIVGHHVRDVIGEEAFAQVRPFFEAALQGQRSRFERELHYRDAGPRHVVVDYVPDVRSDGTVAGFYALVTDVSDRRRAEEAQARLASIVAASGDAILSLSLDGRIETWNAGAQRLFGYRADEAIGQTIQLILPSGSDEEQHTLLERVQRGEVVGPYDTVRCRKDGRRIDVSVTVSPVRDASGRVVGVSKVDRDISALRQADRRKDEFLATLGHELRNPLAAIRTAAELLPAGEVTAILRRQVATMVRLIDDLLDVSRITHGRLELHLERLDLAEVVQQAVEAARPSIEDKAHTLEVLAPDGPLEVEGDPVRLVQVFTNLLGNACRYTDPGGRIQIRIERQADEAVIAFRDSGIGIPPDKLEAVFDLFSRLDDPGHGEGGLGIGLTLSRRLVELHHGSVLAESEGAGHGTTITVRLPALPASAAHPVEVAADEVVAAGSRVLVVDDNVDAADTLAMLLETWGHDVHRCYDGVTALAEAAAFRPDLILLDLGLPDRDGIEVCRTLRAEPWGASIRVVALSGWGQESDKRQTAEAGFDGHLTKPADLDEVRRLLAAVADQPP